MNKKQKTTLLRFDRILAQDLQRQILILLAVLVVIFIMSFFLLSISGSDWQEYCEKEHISKWVFPLYLLIDGNAFHDFCGDEKMNGLTVFFGCIIYIVGVIVFTGMLISVMTNMIERRVEDHRSGLIHYLKSGHYVIMGYDELVPSFISYIFGTKKEQTPYVLILTSVSAEKVNEKLSKTFSKKELERVIVNYGHRTNPETYQEICLESAEEVFIVGYHSQEAHDAINVECVDSICKYLNKPDIKQKPTRITCVFRDIDTYAAFKTTEIFSEVNRLGIEFVPYNFYTNWAKQVFVKRCHKLSYNPKDNNKIDYPSVFGDGIKPDDPQYVHLVFVGTTNFAVAFAMEAAHVLHFPNFIKNMSLRTRITFIDLNADKEKDEFITRNRHFFEVQSYRYQDLSSKPEKHFLDTKAPFSKESQNIEGKDYDFLDVEFEFIKGDIFSQQVQHEISEWAKDKDGQYLSIFLAMANQRSNFVMGMNMPDEVYDNAIPVFIRQDRSDNFVTNLRNADNGKLSYYYMENGKVQKPLERSRRYANIYPFGMNEAAYSADDKSLKRAKLINYLYATADYSNNKFQSMMVLNALPKDMIFAEANKLWNGIPDSSNEKERKGLDVSLKWSNLYNSYSIRIKQATLQAMRGLALKNKSEDTKPLSKEEMEVLACVEHNRWNVEKLLMGYRKPHQNEDKYNAKSDEDEKLLKKNKELFIHHDIRPFNILDHITELDYEFSKYIPWIIEMTEK